MARIHHRASPRPRTPRSWMPAHQLRLMEDLTRAKMPSAPRASILPNASVWLTSERVPSSSNTVEVATHVRAVVARLCVTSAWTRTRSLAITRPPSRRRFARCSERRVALRRCPRTTRVACKATTSRACWLGPMRSTRASHRTRPQVDTCTDTGLAGPPPQPRAAAHGHEETQPETQARLTRKSVTTSRTR